MEKTIPRIIISVGEPAGIGPDIVLQLAAQSFPAELIAVCDPMLLTDRAKQLQLPIELLKHDAPSKQHLPGTLKIIPVPLAAPCVAGTINPANSKYVLDCLTLATDYCLDKKADALVTGPINKAAINAAGIPFTGHTEFLAEHCHVNNVLMLFVVNSMRVALVTTHIPLNKVSAAVTPERLSTTIKLLHRELQNRFGISHPRLFVTGLNPHAGEEGLLGDEEINVIIPTLNRLRNENINVQGPFPADTVFTEKHITQCDAILAMYHDQALPVVKHIGFSSAVNVTLGLPIIRTSVDHGTALDIAGTGQADSGSLIAAIELAAKLSS